MNSLECIRIRTAETNYFRRILKPNNERALKCLNLCKHTKLKDAWIFSFSIRKSRQLLPKSHGRKKKRLSENALLSDYKLRLLMIPVDREASE